MISQDSIMYSLRNLAHQKGRSFLSIFSILVGIATIFIFISYGYDLFTYTDDLNILSFLDYLREMIIHENRQVVFATANQKLAGLFEKKFSFLGEVEFKTFHFERG